MHPEDSDEEFQAAVERATEEMAATMGSPALPLLDLIHGMATAKAHLIEVRRPERRESSAVIFAASTEFRNAEAELSKAISKMIDAEVADIQREDQ